MRVTPGREGLVVIGGGIQGCCAALEAARRGIPTTLVERGELGGATSANTLRILHGGLRYLQQLDLQRMRRSQAARAWFREWFPELVRSLPCLLPLDGRGLHRRWAFAAALAAESALRARRAGGEEELERGRVLSPAETAELFPAVERRGLAGGGLWHDALMPDPRALMREIVRWGQHCGLTVIEGVEAEAVLLAGDGRVAGVRCHEGAAGRFDLPASRVLNCAGPWARQLARRLDRDVPSLFEPSLAFNLLLATPAPARVAVAVPTGPRAQKRFLLPVAEGTLVGTWYLPVAGDGPENAPSDADVAAAVAELAAAIPAWAPRPSQVVGVLAGSLPATRAGTAQLRRRDVVFDHGAEGGPRGLFSVSGVKFTTARELALAALAAAGVPLEASAVPRPRQPDAPRRLVPAAS